MNPLRTHVHSAAAAFAATAAVTWPAARAPQPPAGLNSRIRALDHKLSLVSVDANGDVVVEEGGGSHNLITGEVACYPSYGGLLGALGAEALAPHVAFSDGFGQRATGLPSAAQWSLSVVLGGEGSFARGRAATIVGGDRVSAFGDLSAVIGGTTSLDRGLGSVVVGGPGGRAEVGALYATAVGGALAAVTGPAAIVVGGDANAASGLLGVTIGGRSSDATGENSVVAGGRNNTSSGRNSSNSGGLDRRVSAAHGWVAESLSETQ